MPLAVMTISLAGCETPVFNKPALRNYTPAWQASLADEIDSMKKAQVYPYAREAIIDYGALRGQVRAMK